MGIPDHYNDPDADSPEVGFGFSGDNVKVLSCIKCGKKITTFYSKRRWFDSPLEPLCLKCFAE